MSQLSESDDKHGSLEILNFEQNFVWIISEFSKFDTLEPEKCINSPVFRFETINDEWDMSVEFYPNGVGYGKKDYAALYFFIKAHDSEIDHNNSKANDQAIIVNYTVHLIDKEQQKYHGTKGISSFSEENNCWGESDFIQRSMLMDEKKDFLKDDKLTIHINIRLVNQVSNLYIGRSEKSINLLQDFEQLFENNLFNDVNIVVADTNFSAHRNVLACRSPVFLAMFTHDMKEKRESKVVIEDFSPDVVKEMLRFIYCGKVRNLHILAADLLVAADKYQLDDLKDVCEGELHKNLSSDNAFDTLVVADRYNLDLKEHTLSFISDHSEEIIDTPGFKTLCDSGNSRLIGDAYKHIVAKLRDCNEKSESIAEVSEDYSTMEEEH